jgi:hypothetical protein
VLKVLQTLRQQLLQQQQQQRLLRLLRQWLLAVTAQVR